MPIMFQIFFVTLQCQNYNVSLKKLFLMVKFDSNFREKISVFAAENKFDVKYRHFDDGDLCTLFSSSNDVVFSFSDLLPFAAFCPSFAHFEGILYIHFHEFFD